MSGAIKSSGTLQEIALTFGGGVNTVLRDSC